VSQARDQLIHDLSLAYRPSPPVSRLDAAVLAALREQQRRPASRSWWQRRWGIPQRAAGVVICSAVLAAAFGYLHGQSPATVSAQTVLSRAAAAGLVPGQVTHFTYRLTASNGDTGTSDLWVEADDSGVARRLALSNAVFDGGSAVPGLDVRLVQSGDTVQVYDPASNTVTSGPGDQIDQPWESIVVGTRLAQKLSGGGQGAPFSPVAQKGSPSPVSQQTIDGASVFVLNLVSSTSDRTLYVDAQSYIPRGADWSENGVSWQARLTGYVTMSPSAVPAGTFSLHAPATAKTAQTQPDKSDYPIDFGSAFAAACKTTQEGFKAAMSSAPDQSMLAACRRTNPTITADQLGAALLASAKQQLDAAVEAGTITAAQESDQLTRMRAKLTDTVTMPGGAPAPK
jgi:hypothetical protein